MRKLSSLIFIDLLLCQWMFISTAHSVTLKEAFKNRQSNLQVQGQGRVIKILKDDLGGSKHQKFIIKISSEHTVLIAHNIDLAPRINYLSSGDYIEFYDEYEWNAKSSVVHWTHHDPNKHHVRGWLKHKGKTYQ